MVSTKTISFLDSLHRQMLANQAVRTESADSRLAESSVGNEISDALTVIDLDDDEAKAQALVTPRARTKSAELVTYSQGPSVDGVYRRWDPVRTAKGDDGRTGLIRHLFERRVLHGLTGFDARPSLTTRPPLCLVCQDDFFVTPLPARVPTDFPTTRRPNLEHSTSVQVAVLDSIFDMASARLPSKLSRFKGNDAPGIPGATVYRLSFTERNL